MSRLDGPDVGHASGEKSTRSGRRDSNPRPSAWKADALPTELLPPRHQPQRASWCLKSGGGRIRTFEASRRLIYSQVHLSTLAPHRLVVRLPRPRLHVGSTSWRWDSNPQPAAYKAAALPVELRQHVGRPIVEPCRLGSPVWTSLLIYSGLPSVKRVVSVFDSLRPSQPQKYAQFQGWGASHWRLTS